MTDDARHIWFAQVAGGRIGSFNVETKRYEDSVLLPPDSGPRRITMGANGMLYVPLYGLGQLVEYDTARRRIVGTYDLPDRASAPYAVTWDPVRKIVWIPTSNADVIYRFNPADKSIAVLPMPRQGAFLRMVDVDPRTGFLVTSYANIVENVHGPRMALIIEPGDDAYPARALFAGANTPTVGGAKLVAQRGCQACHAAEQNLIGPSWQAIKARYAATEGASARNTLTEALARKIISGGGGAWGVVPMVPNEHVPEAEARTMAGWLLAPGTPAQ